MSLYGYLVCVDCGERLWLGKAIQPRGDTIDHFQVGDAGAPRNSEQRELTRALWKMVAVHAGHGLRVVVEGQDGYRELLEESRTEIGGDGREDMSFEEYLRDFRG